MDGECSRIGFRSEWRFRLRIDWDTIGATGLSAPWSRTNNQFDKLLIRFMYVCADPVFLTSGEGKYRQRLFVRSSGGRRSSKSQAKARAFRILSSGPGFPYSSNCGHPGKLSALRSITFTPPSTRLSAVRSHQTGSSIPYSETRVAVSRSLCTQVDANNRERRPRIKLKRVYLLWFRSR